jgi:hypothetical protein
MNSLSEKYCVKCKRTLPIRRFYPTDQGVLGQSKYCEECMRVNRNVKDKGYAKNRRMRLRFLAIEKYGGKCECCGETRIEFLAFDHVNGDGNKMRKYKVHPRSSDAFYMWLLKEDRTDVVRILCHNCNLSTGFYGYCPHKSTDT